VAERDITLRIAIEGEDAKRIIDDLEGRGGGGRPGRGQTPVPGFGGGQAPQGGGSANLSKLADIAVVLGALRGAIGQMVSAADKVAQAANEQALQATKFSGLLEPTDAAGRVKGMLQPFEFALGQLPPEQRKAEAARLAGQFHQDFARPGAAGATAIRGATSALMLKENPELAGLMGAYLIARSIKSVQNR